MLSLSKHCPCSSCLARGRPKQSQPFDKLREDGCGEGGALTAQPPPDQPAQREHLQRRHGEQVEIIRLLAGLVPKEAAPVLSLSKEPSVPPRKANSSKVDSAMRYSPRRALALSSPNAAKAMRLIAMRAAAMLAGVKYIIFGLIYFPI